MAGYTKADYDNLYLFRASRHFGLEAGQQEVVVHYVKRWMQPLWQTRWAAMAPVLNIAPTELVLIVGAGFGWGVEAFIAETGCTTVGIDISDYIDAEKGNTEEADIRAAIIAAGHDPNSGHGAAVLAGICDFQPRSNVIILKEDASTNTSRQAIRAALGNWPTVCILEDLIDETTTDGEITLVNNAMNNFAGTQRVIWVFNGNPARSMQDLHTLTGAEVIATDGQTHLVL